MKTQENSASIIGVMSGTSLDGLDLALCSFSHTDRGIAYSIEKYATLSYPEELKQRLDGAPTLSIEALCELDADLGVFIGLGIKDFLSGHYADLIASHGHTVVHKPNKGFSLQIGSPAHIASINHIDVLSNFRSLDVALEGQGAPLVPIGDKLLFSQASACINLGGIANISLRSKEGYRAWDICGCNLILNMLSKQAGKAYDAGGRLSMAGQPSKGLLSQLNQLPYFEDGGRISLDKEEVLHMYTLILTQNLEPSDSLATMVEHIAMKIGSATAHLEATADILVTGGGAHNTYLIDRIRHYCTGNVLIPDKTIIDYKEALVFALMGYLSSIGKPNVEWLATGSKSHIAGMLTKGASICR